MIKSLIFDFGGIFINLDKEATHKELHRLGLEKFSKKMIQINELYEIGKITSHEFLNYYKKEIPNTTEQQLIYAWNSILQNFPIHKLQFLKRLSQEKKYYLILLSNTNDLHINWVKYNIPFYEEFKNCFDAFYLSHEIGYRKPNKAIFEYVLKENQTQANQCLFIDDTLEHIQTAKKLNIHTWNLDPKTEDIVDLFSIKNDLF
ncbi:MAG: HAD-IA family hydrolase [Flavobacteriales bacterium]